ncbi:hypothetical protein [Arthrobacter sp. NQ4]|uniref:hypothetical protein n=1 Tax=Arthrobacter sp. NQ4 TaxID=3027930 RepID=UPI0035A966F3
MQRTHGPAIGLVCKLNAVIDARLPQAEQHAGGIGNQLRTGPGADGPELPAARLFRQR